MKVTEYIIWLSRILSHREKGAGGGKTFAFHQQAFGLMTRRDLSESKRLFRTNGRRSGSLWRTKMINCPSIQSTKLHRRQPRQLSESAMDSSIISSHKT